MKPEGKCGAVGAVEHVRNKLLAHAEMVKGRLVNEATLSLLPSGLQCTMLAEWLGAALVRLEEPSTTRETAFDSSAWLDLLAVGWEAEATLLEGKLAHDPFRTRPENISIEEGERIRIEANRLRLCANELRQWLVGLASKSNKQISETED